MSENTPQIEAILSDLTAMCCDALDQGVVLDHGRMTELVRSLSANGWERKSDDGPPLGTVIERRVLARCQEPAMHRGAALTALVTEINSQYQVEQSDAANSPH